MRNATQKPVVTALFLVPAVLAAALPSLRPAMLFEREAILSGELWRLWTGHLVHFGCWHLGYDLLAAGAASALIEARRRRDLFVLYACMPFFISLALLAGAPEMRCYGGLSGVATGAFAYLALCLPRGRRRWGAGFVLLLLLKTGAEFHTGGSLLPYPGGSGFVPMPMAHLAGIAAGGGLALVPFWRGEHVGREGEDLTPRRNDVKGGTQRERDGITGWTG